MHEHYLSALHQAMQLSQEGIVIYPCGICNGIHLGHVFARHARQCEREREQKIAPLERKIILHRELMRQYEEKIRRLEVEVDRLLMRYS